MKLDVGKSNPPAGANDLTDFSSLSVGVAKSDDLLAGEYNGVCKAMG